MTLTQFLIVIFVVWNVGGFIALGCIPYTHDAELCAYIFTPKGIYDHIKVNWFGCIILTLIFNLLCPVVSICWWFYWLCTVGRK